MHWTELIQNIKKEDTSLQDSFSALSISRVGQGSKDTRLLRASTELYGKALKELQLALYDPKRMNSNQVLMACMLLGLYEVFEGSAFDSRSWLAHAKGAARLVQLRGPARHQEHDAHHPFLASRINTVYAAILQRQSTYLATEEWMTIPWETTPRTYFDRLVDMSVQIPGLLERFDLVRDRKSDVGHELLKILDECTTLQHMMNRWKDGTRPGALPQQVKHEGPSDDGYPFATDLWFGNHLFVHARLVYYTSSLTLAQTVEEVLQVLYARDKKLSLTTDFDTLSQLFEARKHARNICRTVPYCLQPQMGALGPGIILFPANVAFAYYRRIGYSEATTWLAKAFRDLKTRGVNMTNAFNHSSDFIHHRLHHYKRESSSESGGSGASPGSDHSLASTITTFVYEDPSKEYYDASNDPG
jgi:hypothetical protein